MPFSSGLHVMAMISMACRWVASDKLPIRAGTISPFTLYLFQGVEFGALGPVYTTL